MTAQTETPLGEALEETLRGYAAQQVFCEYTGLILDARNVVVIEYWPTDEKITHVVHGKRWDKVSGRFRDLCTRRDVGYHVMDGRTMQEEFG